VFLIWKDITIVGISSDFHSSDLPSTTHTADWSNETLDTDKVLHAFFSACHTAGPLLCAFHAPTPHAISRNLDALYAQVLSQPVVAYSPALPTYGVVDPPTLRNAVFSALLTPYSSFRVLARGLSELQRGNGSVVLQLAQPLADEVNAAVSCGNGRAVEGDAGALRAYVESVSGVSSFAGVVAGIRTVCSYVAWHFLGGVWFLCCMFLSIGDGGSIQIISKVVVNLFRYCAR
jgi:hypothetical protein